MKPAKEHIEVNLWELEALAERVRAALGEEDYQKLEAGIRALGCLTELISDKNTTISQLRALLMKPSTEKTRKVLEQAGVQAVGKATRPRVALGARAGRRSRRPATAAMARRRMGVRGGLKSHMVR